MNRANYPPSTTANFPNVARIARQHMRKPRICPFARKTPYTHRRTTNRKTIKRQKPITIQRTAVTVRARSGGGKIYKVVMETRNSFSCPRCTITLCWSNARRPVQNLQNYRTALQVVEHNIFLPFSLTLSLSKRIIVFSLYYNVQPQRPPPSIERELKYQPKELFFFFLVTLYSSYPQHTSIYKKHSNPFSTCYDVNSANFQYDWYLVTTFY